MASLRRYLRGSSLMAMVILLAGLAMPRLSRMTCLMSGRTVLSLWDTRGCCPAEQGTEGCISASCCAVMVTKAPELRTEPAHRTVVPVQHDVRALVQDHGPAMGMRSAPVASPRVHPPPLTTSERASRICVLRT